MTNFDDLVPGPGERHGIFGTTRAGKSSHQDMETRAISEQRPECMQLLFDTKPRYRAETERMPLNPRGRRSAAWRYTDWAKGPVLPNSVVADMYSDHPFRGLWTKPGEIVIVQSGDVQDWLRMLHLSMAFVKAHVGQRERRLIADEIMDMYGRSTMSIRNRDDVFYLAARSGGERNIGIGFGAQRVKGVPILLRNTMSRCTLYYLDLDMDVHELHANGIRDAECPPGDYAFKQWRKQPGGKFSDPVYGRLEYPESYLNQLAAA